MWPHHASRLLEGAGEQVFSCPLPPLRRIGYSVGRHLGPDGRANRTEPDARRIQGRAGDGVLQRLPCDRCDRISCAGPEMCRVWKLQHSPVRLTKSTGVGGAGARWGSASAKSETLRGRERMAHQHCTHRSWAVSPRRFLRQGRAFSVLSTKETFCPTMRWHSTGGRRAHMLRRQCAKPGDRFCFGTVDVLAGFPDRHQNLSAQRHRGWLRTFQQRSSPHPTPSAPASARAAARAFLAHAAAAHSAAQALTRPCAARSCCTSRL